jgi:cytochrome c-type biogenesis protein CcmH
MRRGTSLLAALLGVLVTVGGAAGQSTQEGLLPDARTGPLADSAQEARATRLAAELRCPVCQGLSIQDSPSPLAQQMKDLIRSQIVDGRSDDEIRNYFVSKYGEWVLLEPRAEGFNLLVYVLPALLLLGGVGFIVLAVRRWTTPADGSEADGAADDPFADDRVGGVERAATTEERARP